ncbi:ubiquitin domain-containing protein 7SL RNA1-like [Malania oleifera]|uniref:ubiquitin domain-containing protein 7SL RNA1-like n=1 Tax=Malania oleifera TaxID=397392 RepID=UPI0025ADA258|nr:ubiquitin domain-containing protein 7SL RNA1-like [Malania oleifera]
MDVIFEPSCGKKPFTVEVGFFDTVLEIKEKIQKYQSIPVATQTLVFNGRVLPDENDVGLCEILQFSRVRLVLTTPSSPPPSEPKKKPRIASADDEDEEEKEMKIQLLLRMPEAGVSVEMDPNDIVMRLKEKIQEIEGVPVYRLALHAKGKELDDHLSLRECELSQHSEIDVGLINKEKGMKTVTMMKMKMKVMVQPRCGSRKIAVEVSAGDSVGELRNELQRLQSSLQFHLPAEGYFFIHNQNVMDEDRSFRWHRVAPGDTIEIFNGTVTAGS